MFWTCKRFVAVVVISNDCNTYSTEYLSLLRTEAKLHHKLWVICIGIRQSILPMLGPSLLHSLPSAFAASSMLFFAAVINQISSPEVWIVWVEQEKLIHWIGEETIHATETWWILLHLIKEDHVSGKCRYILHEPLENWMGAHGFYLHWFVDDLMLQQLYILLVKIIPFLVQ